MEIIIIINIEKEPVMKAEKKDTTCLLNVAGKGSVKDFVQIPVKNITDMSPVHKPVIKGGKGKKSCLLNRGKGLVHVKESNDSWGMENL